MKKKADYHGGLTCSQLLQNPVPFKYPKIREKTHPTLFCMSIENFCQRRQFFVYFLFAVELSRRRSHDPPGE